MRSPKRSPRKKYWRGSSWGRLRRHRGQRPSLWRERRVSKCLFAVDHHLKINSNNYSCYLHISFYIQVVHEKCYEMVSKLIRSLPPPSPSLGVRWTKKKSKSSALKFGPNFSNRFGLAKFCKLRQGEVAWTSHTRVTSVKSQQGQWLTNLQGKAMMGLGSDKNLFYIW